MRGHSHKHGDSHGHDNGGHEHAHGRVDPSIIESKQGVRVLAISLAILGLTAVVQAIIVVLTDSVALLADTVHNFGDALTAVPLAAAFILSRRPPTRRYTYGLHRTEDLAGLFIVAAITFSAGYALYESIQRLITPSKPSHLTLGIIAGVIGFIGNEVVAVYRIRQGKRMHSAALVADGYHARVDGFTSLAVVVGLGFVWFGVDIADPIAGILISVTIFGISWRALRDVGRRVLDGIEPESVDEMTRALHETLRGRATMSQLRARWAGHWVHVDVQVVPDRGATLEDALSIRESIEDSLRSANDRVQSVAVDLIRGSVIQPHGSDGRAAGEAPQRADASDSAQHEDGDHAKAHSSGHGHEHGGHGHDHSHG